MQSGDLLSVSLFYKDLKRPIEKYLRTLDGGIITYINRESAKVYGIEFEARKNLQFIDPLLRPFSIGANVALIQSEVPLTDVELINKRAFDPGVSSTRPLYDQSPYIINVDLSYQNIYTHTIATLLYNLAGSRIYIATGQGPDIYEHPAASLDFVLTQQLTRNLRFKFYAKNLLDPVFERTYGDNPGKFVYSSFTRGRTFGLSLSCDL
jgi:outer membrane receptor protein involved in Fe transport